MTDFTPIPWKCNKLDDDNFGISAGWTDIATVHNRDDDPVDEANAHFIVHAVNNHAALLEALTALMLHIWRGELVLSGTDEVHRVILMETFPKASAAIKATTE